MEREQRAENTGTDQSTVADQDTISMNAWQILLDWLATSGFIAGSLLMLVLITPRTTFYQGNESQDMAWTGNFTHVTWGEDRAGATYFQLGDGLTAGDFDECIRIHDNALNFVYEPWYYFEETSDQMQLMFQNLANAGYQAMRYAAFEGLCYFILFFALKFGKFINTSIVGVYSLLYTGAIIAKIASLLTLTSVSILQGSCDRVSNEGKMEPVCAGITVQCNIVILCMSIVYFLWVMFYRRHVLQRVPEPDEKLKSE